MADNCSEMRKALEYVKDTMLELQNGGSASTLKILMVVEHALATPARNCDVGTVEEQLERHRLYCIGFCTVHECDYDLEKHDAETCKKCFAMWAQMRRSK